MDYPSTERLSSTSMFLLLAATRNKKCNDNSVKCIRFMEHFRNTIIFHYYFFIFVLYPAIRHLF